MYARTIGAHDGLERLPSLCSLGALEEKKIIIIKVGSWTFLMRTRPPGYNDEEQKGGFGMGA